MSAAPDQNYTSFPAVKTEELLSVLHELGLGVTAEDIAKPQGAMVQKVYMAFLDTLAGTMPDTLEKQRDDICRDMDHKDVFEDGVAWLLFFREVRTMMEAATVHDFQLQDLTRPTPKRFKRHMSALVNFFRFRSDRLAEFDELVLETEEMENRRIELEESIERMRQDIDAILAQRQAEEPRVQKLREENLQHSDRLLQMKKEQSRLLEDVDTLKVEKTDAIQKQTDLQYQLQIVATELNKLQARIVTRPDDIRRHLDEMQTQVQGERSTLGENERKAQALRSKMDVLVQLDADMSACIASMDQVAADMERTARESRALEEAKASVASQSQEQMTQTHRNEQLDRQVKSVTERLERAREELEMKRGERQAKLEALTTRLSDVSKVRKERHALAELKNQEATQIERQLESLLQEHEAHYARMQLEKDALCRTAAAYMDTLVRSFSLPT
ncbi:kinetochore-associated Ndc80 complex subunit Nuf2 [Malassezia pachydermatis]|uniref:Myosin-like protein nuf2 n=1 Tax=Malassezia pachydermatis TaxID=77020 RepID=A0A0N0RS44_9BASI|nr:myosin-like protein nuf2 [Malassezia pachydermatis]KOS13803.1 myosin-like protein nuf2 [Malassezia pachydermatis]